MNNLQAPKAQAGSAVHSTSGFTSPIRSDEVAAGRNPNQVSSHTPTPAAIAGAESKEHPLPRSREAAAG